MNGFAYLHKSSDIPYLKSVGGHSSVEYGIRPYRNIAPIIPQY